MTAAAAAAGAAPRTERRYRRLLHAYPPAWRREHGAALLGTLLDVDDSRGNTGPTFGQARDLVVHGLAQRIGYLLPQLRTRELASTLALIIGTAMSVALLTLSEWWFTPRVEGSLVGLRVHGVTWPFVTAEPLLYVLWPFALAAAAAGWHRVARSILLACLAVAVGVLVLDTHFSAIRQTPTVVLGLAGLALVAALAPRPAGSAGARLLGSGAGAGVVLILLDTVRRLWPEGGLEVLRQRSPDTLSAAYYLPDLIFSDLLDVLLLVLVVAALARPWRRHWFPAAMLVASGWYVLALGPVGLLLEGAGQLGALAGIHLIFATAAWWICLAVCLVLGVLAALNRWRGGRRLSPPSVPIR